jgi:hypothetical protein
VKKIGFERVGHRHFAEPLEAAALRPAAVRSRAGRSVFADLDERVVGA